MKKGLTRLLLVMISLTLIVSTIPAYEPYAEQHVPPVERPEQGTPEKTEVVEEQEQTENEVPVVTTVEEEGAPSVKVDGDWKDPYYDTVRRSRSVALEKPEKATIKTASNGVGTGTGAMNLSWKAMPGATGYKVIIGNGYNYEYFSVGNVTSWTTKGKGIFPTKAELDKGLYRFHTDGKGTEFANDPTQLYENTFKAGTTWTLRGQKKYIVRVLATYTSGDGPTSDITEAVMPPETLPAKPEKSVIKTVSSGAGTGTGYMDISWQAVAGAIDYKVVISNGYNYEYFNTGNTTNWTTKGKGIFPTQAEIANKQYKFHQDGKGVEFASDPRALYENGYQAGSTFGLRNQEKYIVRILAVYPWGDGVTSDITNSYMPLETMSPPMGQAYANAKGTNTGYVNLEWPEVAGADGYRVTIFDGKKNIYFDAGEETSWTTKGKGIWPSQQEVEAGGWNVRTDGTGTELAIDPSPVYRNSNGVYGERKNYWFRVQAYTNNGNRADSVISDVYTPIMPTEQILSWISETSEIESFLLTYLKESGKDISINSSEFSQFATDQVDKDMDVILSNREDYPIIFSYLMDYLMAEDISSEVPDTESLQELGLSDNEIEELQSAEADDIILIDGVAYKDGVLIDSESMERGKLTWAVKAIKAVYKKLPARVKGHVDSVGLGSLLMFIEHYTGKLEEAIYKKVYQSTRSKTVAWLVSKTIMLLI